MADPKDTGTFDFWISDRIGPTVAAPKSGGTGEFDRWISDQLTFNYAVYAVTVVKPLVIRFDEIAPVPVRGNTTSSFDHWRGGELITVHHGAIPETFYWRGDEQAPVPAQGVTAGGLDFWRGGELLPVFQEAIPETNYWRNEELTGLAPYKVSVGTFDFWQGDELLIVYSEGAPVEAERLMELLFIRQPIPAGIFDI
jgi:hypothetical protein